MSLEPVYKNIKEHLALGSKVLTLYTSFACLAAHLAILIIFFCQSKTSGSSARLLPSFVTGCEGLSWRSANADLPWGFRGGGFGNSLMLSLPIYRFSNSKVMWHLPLRYDQKAANGIHLLGGISDITRSFQVWLIIKSTG